MPISADPAAIFAALGDPVRLALVEALESGRAHSITDLARGRAITRQGVTKHLKVLEAAGLAVSAREGREVLWRGRAAALTPARDCLARIGARWEGALERLKRQAEGS